MRLLTLVPLLLVLWATPVIAQTTVTPNQRLRWDQAVADAADLALMTWDLVVDGTAVAPVVTPTACVLGTATQATCTAALPAMTPGPHALTVRVNRTQGGATLSATSLPLTIVMYALVAPAGLAIVP